MLHVTTYIRQVKTHGAYQLYVVYTRIRLIRKHSSQATKSGRDDLCKMTAEKGCVMWDENKRARIATGVKSKKSSLKFVLYVKHWQATFELSRSSKQSAYTLYVPDVCNHRAGMRTCRYRDARGICQILCHIIIYATSPRNNHAGNKESCREITMSVTRNLAGALLRRTELTLNHSAKSLSYPETTTARAVSSY